LANTKPEFQIAANQALKETTTSKTLDDYLQHLEPLTDVVQVYPPPIKADTKQ
jgi:hypothetical protein